MLYFSVVDTIILTHKDGKRVAFVVAGTKVVLPLIATALLMCLVMPVIVAQASTMIEDHRRAKKKAQGLNVKA